MTLLNMRQAAKVAGVSVGMLTDVKIASAGQAGQSEGVRLKKFT